MNQEDKKKKSNFIEGIVQSDVGQCTICQKETKFRHAKDGTYLCSQECFNYYETMIRVHYKDLED